MYLSEIFLFTLFIFPLQYLSEITYYYNRDKAMIAKMPQNCFHGPGQHKSDDINHHASAQQLQSGCQCHKGQCYFRTARDLQQPEHLKQKLKNKAIVCYTCKIAEENYYLKKGLCCSYGMKK